MCDSPMLVTMAPEKEAAYANEVGQDAEVLARGNTHVVKEL